MVKCKNCIFCDYLRTGRFHGYYICVLNGTKRVNELIDHNCTKFKEADDGIL